ncbi:HAL [Mytilus edulis]|uniref:HutH n=1 Tax=Mytilus edulis TaxID=6550 RepID=A0A8S3R0E3_MYTED|nr:HAL [Mytilus edulis]
MKLSARVRGDWFAVPCKGGESVKWLGEETLRRYYKAKSSSGHAIEKVFEVRKAKGGAILDQDDAIKHVLDDNDFVTVVLDSDMSSPVTGPAEPVYVEEKICNILLSKCQLFSLTNSRPEASVERAREMTVDAEQKVQKARDLLEDIVDKNKLVYGITTGFGKFARVNVEKDKLNELQENLIRSHAAGVGPPLSPERTRMLLALRINVLTKGFVTFLNLASCLPWIPEKGTVGASGDLAPLSHLALGMMGEGKMWSPKSGWADAKYVLEFNNLEPIKLGPKEGLALINGTQLIAALGAEAVERAESIARQADVVAAFTLDVLKGSTRAFDSSK